MSRILLADDSPHAQRMGERILREEGFEVVTVTDGNTALLRLADVDPDLVFADVSLPSKSGYEICSQVKSRPKHKHVRVVLTAGLLEPFDEPQAAEVKADGVLKKPFESSVVLEMVRPLIEAAIRDREALAKDGPIFTPPEPPKPNPEVASPVFRPASPATAAPAFGFASVSPAVQVKVVPEDKVLPPDTAEPLLARTAPLQVAGEVDPQRVRAAVTLALDAAMPALIDEITQKVLVALGH